MKEYLQTLAEWLQVTGQLMEDVLVTGVSIDTRTIQEGDLFIPFRGEQVNGHRFVQQAFEKGAAAALWMKDEANPPTDVPLLFVEDPEQALQQMARAYREKVNCKVIGITGSNGKTSTKDLIASVLSPYFKVQKTEGNFNNELGMPLTILSLAEDTEVAVLEMGMSGFGEISFLSTMARPDFSVITNIGEAHMQDLGSREGIAQAKFEIIDGLHQEGVLLYDGDEPLLQPFLAKQAGLKSYGFGYQSNNDVMIDEVEATEAGSKFTTRHLIEDSFVIPVYGKHQVKNSLAAIMIGHFLQLTNEQIKASLLSAQLTDMRMQPITGERGALYINDAYNAAPTSMRAALSFMAETSVRPKKWVVLGDMLELGDEERAYHEALADVLADMDLAGILLYGPRMKWLYDRLEKLPMQAELLWTANDYTVLHDFLADRMDDQSVILLKGSRGMALENLLK